MAPRSSTLQLRVSQGSEEPYVEFIVDGEELGARVKAALGEAGFDDALPWWGIDYKPDDTVLGERARGSGAKRAILFACDCACAMCSSVTADVDVSGDTLTLSNFSTWRHGREIVAPLPPIVFDRRQFDDAVRGLQRELEAWRTRTSRATDT